MESLNEQIELENPAESAVPGLAEGPLDWEQMWKHYATLYVRYISIFRDLELCYDEMVHPQKRRDVKAALKSVMSRLVMLKEQLKFFGFEGSRIEYVNLDDLVINLKLDPSDLEIPVPRYFREEDDQIKPSGAKDMYILSRCMKMNESNISVPQNEPLPKFVRPMDRAEAIRIIQRNERGRQGCLRAKLMRQCRLEEKKAASKAEYEAFDIKAATTALVVGHLDRSKTRAMRKREMDFIGMFPKKYDDGKSEAAKQSDENRLQRKKVQAFNERDFATKLQMLKSKVMESDGAEINDELWEERYNWYVSYKRLNKEYPKDWSGFYRKKHLESLTPEQQAAFLALEDKKDEEKGKKKKKGKKGKKEKKKGKKKKEKAAPSENAEVTLGAPVPELVDHMHESVQKYKQVWATLDETSNFEQTFDEGIARKTVRGLVRDEICPNVDVQLLAYLNNIVGSKGKKEKKGKKKGKKAKKKKEKKAGGEEGKKEEAKEGGEAKEAKKKKKPKAKKGKKGKTSKAKKPSAGEKAVKELLGDTPEEEKLMAMVQRLVKIGIIKKLVDPKPLSELVGDMNVLGSHQQQKLDTFNDPSMAQLRACVTVHGILPLGEQYVKDMQFKVPSVPPTNTMLLVGPKGTGKTLIAKAIAYHTNAIFMDMSPKNVAGKLEGKEAAAAMAWMSFEVAKHYSGHGKPTVMYIDEVEKVWFELPKGKKAKAENKDLPPSVMKYWRKYIEEGKGGLKPNKTTGLAPRVLIVGNTARPKYEFIMKDKELKSFFGKIFFTPIPDYATRLQIWKHYINRTGLDCTELSLNRKFSLSILAHASAGYSAGSIRAAVKLTLWDSKVKKLKKMLNAGRASCVTTNEFVSALSKVPFVFKGDYEKFVAFACKMNGEAKRRKAKNNPEASAGDGKKKKKKKKKK